MTHASDSMRCSRASEVASVPCIISSFMRRQEYVAGIILPRTSVVRQIIDAIGMNLGASEQQVEGQNSQCQRSLNDYFASRSAIGRYPGTARCSFEQSVTVIQGMAGIGKTTLAAMVCHNLKVRQHFSGGIAWIDLGKYTNKTKDSRGDDQRNAFSSERNDELIDDFRSSLRPLNAEGSDSFSSQENNPPQASGFFGIIRPDRKSSSRRGSCDSVSMVTALESATLRGNLPKTVRTEKKTPFAKRRSKSALGSGDGLWPITLNVLVNCYISICHQLGVDVPIKFYQEQQLLTDQCSCLDKCDERRRMEDVRQIMSNALLQKNNQETSDPNCTLIVLDDVWNPNDIEWFRFDSGARTDFSASTVGQINATSMCHILATTRLSAKFQSANQVHAVTLTDEESISLLLNGALSSSDNYSIQGASQVSAEDGNDKISCSLRALAKCITVKCGNLPSAVISSIRWLHHIQLETGSNARKAFDELAQLFKTSNFFANNPEWEDDLDLFPVIDRTLSEYFLGATTSRILKVLLVTFVVSFHNSDHNRPDKQMPCVPLEYVKILWDSILQSDAVSNNEREFFDEGQMRKCRSAFSRVLDTLIILGVIEKLSTKSSNGRNVDCLRITHDMYRQYVEFLFEDDEYDQLGLLRLAPKEQLKKEWNLILANACESKSQERGGCEGTFGFFDDHAYEMLPTYMIQGHKLEEAAAALNDMNFIKGRLVALGAVKGTKCHISDFDLLRTQIKKNGRKGNADNKSTTISSFQKVTTYLRREIDRRDEGCEFDKHSKEAALAMHEMGSSLVNSHWWDDSLKYNEDCLGIKREVFGNDHLEVSKTLILLGRIWLKKKQISKHVKNSALGLYKEALEIQKQSLGDTHTEVATTLLVIGDIHCDEQRYLEAIKTISEALKIQKVTLGGDHKDTADTLRHLGEVHFYLAAHDKALACYNEALGIKREILGYDHISCGKLAFLIGMVHKTEKKFLPAADILREAVQIFTVNGVERDHPDVVEAQLLINWVTSEVRRKERSISLKPFALKLGL